MSSEAEALKEEVKRMLVETLMLTTPPGEIEDTRPLFGAGGLGLDSIDALQIVVALEKQYGLKVADPAAAREILKDVATLADAVAAHRQAQGTDSSAA